MPAQQSPLEEKEPEMTEYKQYEVAVPDKIEINEELRIEIEELEAIAAPAAYTLERLSANHSETLVAD
jgi:hypothetical protein